MYFVSTNVVETITRVGVVTLPRKNENVIKEDGLNITHYHLVLRYISISTILSTYCY